MQKSMAIHSSQEALALAVRDWLLNSGQLVKADVMRVANLIQLVKPMQKKHDKEFTEIMDLFEGAEGTFNPIFDQTGYLSKPELSYEIDLSEIFGKLWLIMHEEELIPPGLLSKGKELWE